MRALLAIGFQVVAVCSIAAAQVRNLRLDDTDPDEGEVAGVIRWEQPADGTHGFAHYGAFFSTSYEAGGTETRVEHHVLVGAFTSELIVSENTAIPAGATYLLLYLVYPDGTNNDTTVSYACLKDAHDGNNNGYAKMMYFTTRGYAKADAAKTYLTTEPACAVQPHNVAIEMVATTYYNIDSLEVEDFDDSAGLEDDCGAPHWPDCAAPHVCVGGYCRSSTATFLVKFPTGNNFETTQTALNTQGFLTNAAVPSFYSGKGAVANTYSIGTVAVSSEILSTFSPCRDSPPTMSSEYCGYAPLQSDPDIGWKLCKSLVYFRMALAAVTNRLGDVIMITEDEKQAAISELQKVWISYRNTSFVDMASTAATQGGMQLYMSETSRARCWQVTGVDYHADCTCPDFPNCGLSADP